MLGISIRGTWGWMQTTDRKCAGTLRGREGLKWWVHCAATGRMGRRLILELGRVLPGHGHDQYSPLHLRILCCRRVHARHHALLAAPGARRSVGALRNRVTSKEFPDITVLPVSHLEPMQE